jgi:hypothetical protein
LVDLVRFVSRADTFGRHFALADIFGYTRPENGMTSP